MIAHRKGNRHVRSWWIFFVVPFLLGAKPSDDRDTTPCAVAREIAIKGVFIYDHDAKQGVAALKKANEMCPSEFGIGFNLGLAHYLAGDLKEAAESWEISHVVLPDHEKTLANLAWVRFELGRDKEAHELAEVGAARYPNNWPLAHTNVLSLFRLGRYLEAYDWLNRSGLKGIQADQWTQQAASYVVETQWRRFRNKEQIQAVRHAVNLLVKWYPEESLFVEAKDRLLLAHLDENAEVPYPIDLPHETWKKTGNVDDQSVILDDMIKTVPSLEDWQQRGDAFALFVGISRYSRLRARHFADRDASNMRQLLVGRGLFKDDVDNVRLRLDQEATREALVSDLQWLIRQGQLNPNALLIFYFSGLGVSWSSGEAATVDDVLLIPVEARMTEISPQTTLSLGQFKTALEKLPNQNIMVILDTCFSNNEVCAVYDTGGYIPQNNPDVSVAPGQAFFASKHAWVVADLQKGAKLYAPGRQGELTYFLLKGMLGEGDGADGTPPDGWVDLNEAASFVKNRLSSQKSDLFLSQPAKIRLTKTAGEK